jgi:hypothetical protein
MTKPVRFPSRALLLAGFLACPGPVEAQRAPNGPAADSAFLLRRASSSVYVISSPCPGRRTVNTRFRAVTLAAGEAVVLEEEEDVTVLNCNEGSDGRVTVTVWSPSRPARRLATFTAFGDQGEPLLPDELYRAGRFAPLYRVRNSGCCGALDRYTYYNLRTGRAVFVSTAPIRWLFANGTIRYLAVLTDGASGPVPSSRWTPRTAAIVQYGTGSGPPQLMPVWGDSGAWYAVAGVAVRRDLPPDSGGSVVLAGPCCNPRDTVPVSGVTARMRLDDLGYGDNHPNLLVSVPIVGDRLRTPQVRRLPVP